MNRDKSLMEELIEAGYPRKQMFNHGSMLYIFDTPLSREVVKKWFRKKGYGMEPFIKKCKDEITGFPMFDIAFAYDPYWEEIARITANRKRR